MQNSLFYITAPSMEISEIIAEQLVEKKLVACVNIFPRLKSFCYWEGQVQSEEEVKEVHPYDVPCIISWQIEAGYQPFMEWIAEETRQAVNKTDK